MKYHCKGFIINPVKLSTHPSQYESLRIFVKLDFELADPVQSKLPIFIYPCHNNNTNNKNNNNNLNSTRNKDSTCLIFGRCLMAVNNVSLRCTEGFSKVSGRHDEGVTKVFGGVLGCVWWCWVGWVEVSVGCLERDPKHKTK